MMRVRKDRTQVHRGTFLQWGADSISEIIEFPIGLPERLKAA